jgi:hypothetical protein
MELEGVESASAVGPTGGPLSGCAHRPMQPSEACSAMRRALDAECDRACVIAAAAEPFEILASNAAFTQLLGHSADGLALKILYGQTTRSEALESAIASANQGGVYCQLRLYTAQGNPLLLRVQVSAIHSGGKLESERKMVSLSFLPAQHVRR